MIYLFYPSKIIGGAEFLFFRTALLLEKSGRDVVLFDIEGGWLSNNVDSLGIKKIIYNGKKIELNDQDILITTSNLMYNLDLFFKKSDAKILFWTIQPYNILFNFSNGKKTLRNIFISTYTKICESSHVDYLNELISKNSIVAMDGECNKVLKKFYGLKYNEFLPIYIDSESFNRLANIKELHNIVEAIWIGRIDLEFKIYILKKVIKDLNELCENKKYRVNFNIVGDGPGYEILKNFSNEIKNISINFLGEKHGDDLTELIMNQNIGFAMGTSALDIAAKGIPTVLLDFSYTELENNKYRWIFESSDAVTGRDIALLEQSEYDEMYTIKEVFSQLFAQYSTKAELSYKYVSLNHSSENVLDKLLKYLDNASFTFSDLYRYRRLKPLWAFKVKNRLSGEY